MVGSQEGARMVRCWFRDIFTWGDLSVVDVVVAKGFVAHGQGDHPGSRGAGAF
jgi:glycosyltransferase A (GT-A) superfamily protein (DUF2064 family)